MQYHKTVLNNEVLQYLQVKKGEWYLDCTLGDGGHSLEILKQGGLVVGIDQDPVALQRAEERFKQNGIADSQFRLIKSNFKDLDQVVSDDRFLGCVFDLGVSGRQFDDGNLGFSFSKEAVLDMRMDPQLQVRAIDLVNGLNKGELEKLFLTFGEFRDKRVVDAIIREREKQRIETTTRLAAVVEQAVGRPTRRKQIHPATLVFQSLRIAVNDELNVLKEGLPKVMEVLQKNGRIIVISFHSLEDRIVKHLFKEWEVGGLGQAITDKVVVPTEDEINKNPRSRSSKLRVFEKNV